MKRLMPSPVDAGELVEVPGPEPFVYDPDIHYVCIDNVEMGPFMDVLNWETREHVYRYVTKEVTSICCRCCGQIILEDVDPDKIVQ